MTLINHTYGFVFVHVPKNAGTSVTRYLSPLSTYRDLEIGATRLGEEMAPAFRERFGLHKHSTLAEIRDVMGPEAMAGYRTIAVVRDPEDRVRSVYRFLSTWQHWASLDPDYGDYAADFTPAASSSTVRTGRAREILAGLGRRPDAIASTAAERDRRATVEGLADVDDFIASELFLRPGPDRLFLPQVTWLALDEESVAVDHVIRYTHLEADLAGVVDALGLPIEHLKEPLPHANASDGRQDRPLRLDSVARLQRRYARDYELLGPWADPAGSGLAHR
jgi:Sulfotransferase family